MSSRQIRSLILLASVTLLVAAGCAKQPSEESASARLTQEQAQAAQAAQAEEAAQTAQAEQAAAAQQGIREEAVTEGQAGAAAGMTAASAAAESAQAAIANLTRVYFDYDQYVLSQSARDTLAQNAMVLKAAPALKVRVEGHCDERGSDQYNIALGERRAQAAANYLASLGVEPARMTTVSYGEEMPLDPGHNEAAWAKNRRVEFKPAE